MMDSPANHSTPKQRPRRVTRLASYSLATALLILASTQTQAESPEPKQINEKCTDYVGCVDGLYCVQTRDGERKCSACKQDELDGYSNVVDDKCKEQAWTPDSSEAFQKALAPDNRVLLDVYYQMLDIAGQCQEARLNREKTCWNGGDDDHKKALQQVADSIQRLKDDKERRVNTKTVYYGSTDTYKNRLSDYNSKCANLNFSDINQNLDKMTNDQDKGNKINCSDIDSYSDTCQKCYEAASGLLDDGFDNSSYKFPGDYADMLRQAKDTLARTHDLLDKTKSKNLCE